MAVEMSYRVALRKASSRDLVVIFQGFHCFGPFISDILIFNLVNTLVECHL